MRNIELESLLDEDILAGEHDLINEGGKAVDNQFYDKILKNTGIILGGAVFGILASLVAQKLIGRNQGSRAFFGKTTDDIRKINHVHGRGWKQNFGVPTYADINELTFNLDRISKDVYQNENDIARINKLIGKS